MFSLPARKRRTLVSLAESDRRRPQVGAVGLLHVVNVARHIQLVSFVEYRRTKVIFNTAYRLKAAKQHTRHFERHARVETRSVAAAGLGAAVSVFHIPTTIGAARRFAVFGCSALCSLYGAY